MKSHSAARPICCVHTGGKLKVRLARGLIYGSWGRDVEKILSAIFYGFFKKIMLVHVSMAMDVYSDG